MAALVVVVGLTSAPATAQSFRDHYKAGRQAFEAEDWPQVVREMEAAVALRPKERLRLVQLAFGRYIPRYYLGVARAELDRCSEALSIWAEGEAQGVVQKIPDVYSDQQARAARCKRHLASLREAAGRGRRLLQEAQTRVGAMRAKMENPVLGDEELLTLLASVEGRLEEARRAITSGSSRGELATLRRGSRLVERTDGDLDRVAAEIARREAVAAEYAEAQRREVDRLVEAAHQVLADVRRVEPYPPRIGARVDALRIAVARVGNDPDLPLSVLAELERSLRRDVGALRSLLLPPSEELRAAAGAFLAGRYREVIEVLDATALAPGRETAHACVLRVGALLSLYRLGGETEQALLDDAARRIDACPDLEDHVVLNPRFVSPELAAFLRSGVAATVGPPAPAVAESR